MFRQFSVRNRIGVGCILAAALCGAGCATGSIDSGRGQDSLPEPVEGEQPFETAAGEAGYHTLAAEIALQREDYATAAREYRLAADLSDDPALAARAAGVAFELDQNAEALKAAKRWAELAPDNAQAHRYLASLYIRHGDAAAAANSLDIVLKTLGEDRGQGLLALSSMLMDETRLDVAREALAKLVARYPNEGRGYYALGTLALSAGDSARALSAARRAVELSADSTQAELLLARALVTAGDTDGGIELASDIVDRDPTAESRLEYAILLAAVGRDDDARIELDALLLDEPNMVSALRSAGLVALRQNDLDGAEVYFNALLASNRRSYEAVYYLAGIAEEREDYARAAALYSQVRVGGRVVAAQHGAARALLAMEGRERAIEYLRAFADTQPRYAVDMLVAEAQLVSDGGDAEAALGVYNDALARFPDNEALLYARAFHLDSMARIDDAVRELRAIVAARPDDPVALNALGYTLADRTSKTREAYRLIKKALALAPDNPAIVDSMGWVQYRRGKLDDALRYLERAWILARDPEIAAHLGEVLWVLGRQDDARNLWASALAENPGADVLEEVMQRFDP